MIRCVAIKAGAISTSVGISIGNVGDERVKSEDGRLFTVLMFVAGLGLTALFAVACFLAFCW